MHRTRVLHALGCCQIQILIDSILAKYIPRKSQHQLKSIFVRIQQQAGALLAAVIVYERKGNPSGSKTKSCRMIVARF